MKHNRKVLAITVFILSFFLIVLGLPNTLANNRVHEISTFEELVEYATIVDSAGYKNVAEVYDYSNKYMSISRLVDLNGEDETYLNNVLNI